MYSRNTSTGALTPLSTPTINNAGSEDATISADGGFIYAANYDTGTISMYRRD